MSTHVIETRSIERTPRGSYRAIARCSCTTTVQLVRPTTGSAEGALDAAFARHVKQETNPDPPSTWLSGSGAPSKESSGEADSIVGWGLLAAAVTLLCLTTLIFISVRSSGDDDTPSTPTSYSTYDPDEGIDCSEEGAWIADMHDRGEFTGKVYQSWLDALDDCVDE